MSGFTVTAKLVNRLNTATLASFTPSWIDQAVGKFNLKLTATTTQGISSEGLYDVLITEPGGDRFYLLQGRSNLDTGISGMP